MSPAPRLILTLPARLNPPGRALLPVQHSLPGRQRGAALLVALAIIALASFIALQMTLRLELDIARTTTLQRNFAAAEFARGLESLARRQLHDDFVNNPGTDTLNDGWASPLPPLPVPGGSVSGRLFELSGRFNINWVVDNGLADEARVAMLRRLLAALELDASLAEAITDWVDSDNQPRSNGAESAAYVDRKPSYRAANRPLSHISELRLVAGISPEVYQRLLPHVSALPVNANQRRLNVNTASVETLMALDDGMTRERARQLVDNGNASFTSVDAFLQHPAMNGIVLPRANTQLSVASSHFLAQALVTLDEVPRRFFILLERDGNSYHVLHRSYGTP